MAHLCSVRSARRCRCRRRTSGSQLRVQRRSASRSGRRRGVKAQPPSDAVRARPCVTGPPAPSARTHHGRRLGDGAAGSGPGGPGLLVGQLAFDRAEEALGEGRLQAVPANVVRPARAAQASGDRGVDARTAFGAPAPDRPIPRPPVPSPHPGHPGALPVDPPPWRAAMREDLLDLAADAATGLAWRYGRGGPGGPRRVVAACR